LHETHFRNAEAISLRLQADLKLRHPFADLGTEGRASEVVASVDDQPSTPAPFKGRTGFTKGFESLGFSATTDLSTDI
jgi:hypothetical protein